MAACKSHSQKRNSESALR
uniref:Uncharacterized protein n=1 Tax=Anguilla anguilla TaxID=7936 RepID=A0A0E9S030_ANGAN